MWYAIEDNGLWDIAYAESIDGEYWEDGVVVSTAIDSKCRLKSAYKTPMSYFRLEGESAGYQGTVEVGGQHSWNPELGSHSFCGHGSIRFLCIIFRWCVYRRSVGTLSVVAMKDARDLVHRYLTESGEQGIWSTFK